VLVAVYRSERTCLSSAAVASDSDKCYAEFERRLASITDNREKQRPPVYYQRSVCLLLYVLLPFILMTEMSSTQCRSEVGPEGAGQP